MRMRRLAEKEEEKGKNYESREKELLQQMSAIKDSNRKGAGIRASSGTLLHVFVNISCQ